MSESSNEDDEQQQGPRGRPNAWWAENREEVSTYGASFRGVPAPRRGAQNVTEEDLLGSEDYCWCGQPAGHDWPGKASGRKHPKEQRVSAMTEPNTVARADFKTFNKDIAAIAVEAINTYGCRYSIARNTATVHGLDGSPMTFGASSGGPDYRKAKSWFQRHVLDVLEAAKQEVAKSAPKPEPRTVQETDVAALALALNGPEHPVEGGRRVEPEVVEVDQPSVSMEETGWRQHIGSNGDPVDDIEVRDTEGGVEFRCLKCPDWHGTSPYGIGGHRRTRHTDTEDLWGPEARAKSTETRRVALLQERVKDALTILLDVANVPDQAAQVEALREKYEQEKRRADDLQARLDLIKEATGL